MRDNISGAALTETTLLVLLAVYTPRHGYGIMQFITEETGGRVRLGAGTLYGALATLEKKGWIEPAGTGADGDRKKEYVITPAGRQAVSRETERLAQIHATALRIVSGERGGEE